MLSQQSVQTISADEKQKRLKAIEKEFVKIGIIDAPGTLMVGLGLYAKFAANGNAFWPLLNDDAVVNSFLLFGGAIMLWGGWQAIKLGRQRSVLEKTPVK